MSWLVEEGIGEVRAIRLVADTIAEARLDSPGGLATGLVANAKLISRPRGGQRGLAEFPGGELANVERLAPDVSEGATIRLLVSRPAIGEAGRTKLARARPTDWPLRRAPTLAEALAAEGPAVRVVRRFAGAGLPAGAWDALMSDAFAREVAFAGGTLVLSPTPAMTLIDIDGELSPRVLALAACAPIGQALARFDIGGQVGIDFPTLASKEDRRAVDETLARALAGRAHERTAMNGFGFVQIVSRFERVSILHRACHQPAATAARLLLRRAEMLEGPGILELAGHPALAPHLRSEWLDQLRRRTAREVRWRADPALALEAPHAQSVAP